MKLLCKKLLRLSCLPATYCWENQDNHQKLGTIIKVSHPNSVSDYAVVYAIRKSTNNPVTHFIELHILDFGL